MRFDEFVLRVPGDEFRIRLHEHLTVLAGIGVLERKALADSFVAALTGEADNTVLTCIDDTGRTLELRALGGRVEAKFLDDGSAAPKPIGWFATDAGALRDLVLLEADELGLATPADDADEPAELAEARATLRALTAELHGTLAARQRTERAKVELDAIDQRIRVAEGGAARREYARALANLERIRAEAAAFQSGTSGAESDRRLLGAADESRTLAERWTELHDAAEAARIDFGETERLPEGDVAALADIPDVLPHDLDDIVEELRQAAEHVSTIESKLLQLATASLAQPEDPRVPLLATVDQPELWAAHHRLADAASALEHQHGAVGGLGAGADTSAAIDELETTHRRVEDIETLIEERRVPVIGGAAIAAVAAIVFAGPAPILALVMLIGACVGTFASLGGPFRERAEAHRDEAKALTRLGVPTYLSFHMRRVDATLDPSSRGRLGEVEVEHTDALRAWSGIAGGVSAEDATALEPEVRTYADALRRDRGPMDAVSALRRELDDAARPRLERARRVVADTCVAFLVTEAEIMASPAWIADMVRERVALRSTARAQRHLEEVEGDEEKVSSRLDGLLADLGFADGSLDARIGALDWAVERAKDRENARSGARSKKDVEADLTRLQAEVRQLRRPEWAEVDAAEADEPDAETLIARRDELIVALQSDAGVNADLDRLADRHSAMERRVAALEAQLCTKDSDEEKSDLGDVHRSLIAHLTRAARVGPRAEPVPVLLDDPFVRVPAERKWELMDMLRRLAEKTQLVYLTDDPFVGAWARRRAASGSVTLLEPVDETS